MKNIFFTFLAIVALASCSAPKYAYYFDNHDYQAGKRKKKAPAQEVALVTTEEIKQIVQDLPQGDVDMAVASTGKEIYPSKAAVKTSIKAQPDATPLTLSKESKHELKKQIKSAIKEYKHQAPEASQGGGDKNQLVALLLAIFLGGLGIHRFYIGRTGTALAQLGLFLLGVLLVFPLIALGIWVLIDIIRIAMGKLTPKNGAYNPDL